MPAATSRLVPTLAAITLAGAGLGALDDVAPVITLLDSDIQPTVPYVYQSESNPPAAFSASVLEDDLYLYDGTAPLGSRWQEFDQSYRVATHAGIAVIASSVGSASGQWQYRLAAQGGAWTSLPSPAAIDDAHAFLLPTVYTSFSTLYSTGLELRFVPTAGSADGSPSLSFRAWDGSAGSSESTVDTTWLDANENTIAGGSPTAYSAESRSIKVDVRAASNTAPDITDIDGVGGTSLDIHPGTTRFIPISVDDSDGDEISWTIGSSYGSSYSASFGFNASEQYGIFLTGGATFDTITFTASDGHGGSDVLLVNTNPINNAPVITDPDAVDGTTQDLHPGTEVFIPISATDSDGDEITWSISSSYGSSSSAYFGYDASENYGIYLTAGETFSTLTFTASDGLGGSDAIVVSTNPTNAAPAISDPDGRAAGAPIQIHAGDSIDLASLNITASDPDAHDTTLDWSSGYTANYSYVSGTTFNAGSAVGLDTATFTVSDAHGASDSITLTFDILPSLNHNPDVTPHSGLLSGEGWYLPVVTGGKGTFTLRVTDPDGDAVAYDGFYDTGEGLNDPSYGDLSAPIVSTGQGYTDFTFVYTHNGSQGRSDWFEVQFSDGKSGTVTMPVGVDVRENTQPQIVTTVPGLAVRGVPYSAVITIRDDDADPALSLTLPGFSLTPLTPTVVKSEEYQSYSLRTYRLDFTPSMPGTVALNFGVSDGSIVNTDSYTVTVGDPEVEPVTSPTVPASTPGNPIYAAIAPGSTAGWSSLMGALAPIGPDAARAWWWSTPARGFYDAEASPVAAARQPATALFLASTVPLSYSFDAKPYPMPYAIDLPPASTQAAGPGSDGWTFFGVPPLWDGETTTTTHTLGDFVLETADGQRVTNDNDILVALAPVDTYTVQAPWSYDPAQPAESRYQAATTLTTGSGYWIRNRSTTAYRLVRVAGDDYIGSRLSSVGNYEGQTAARPAAVVFTAGAAVATAADTPPAPPAGSTQAAATSGSSCGAGGLTGLLLGALAVIGLRNRRRN